MISSAFRRWCITDALEFVVFVITQCGSWSPLNYTVSISPVITALFRFPGSERSLDFDCANQQQCWNVNDDHHGCAIPTYEIRPVKYLSNDREVSRNLGNASTLRCCVPFAEKISSFSVGFADENIGSLAVLLN